jgi:hypothetical protein
VEAAAEAREAEADVVDGAARRAAAASARRSDSDTDHPSSGTLDDSFHQKAATVRGSIPSPVEVVPTRPIGP